MRPIVSYRLTACVDSTPYRNSLPISTPFTSLRGRPRIVKKPAYGQVRAFEVSLFASLFAILAKSAGIVHPLFTRPRPIQPHA
jgi:hypothetical protein